MNLFRRTVLKLTVLLLLLLAVNQVYKLTFWKKDISRHGDVLENLWQVDTTSDAIYFGESSNFHVPEGDTVKHRISYILDELMPDVKLATVDNAGLHAGTYLAVMRNIPDEMKLKFVVVTMNYRSFDATWRYADFENYLAKTNRMLEPGLPVINKFRVSLRDYDNRTTAERELQVKNAWKNETFSIPGFPYNNVISWDSAMAWGTWKQSNPLLNDTTIPLACHYIKNFAFVIDTNSNQRISDFDQIVDWGKKRGVKVVFNLLSENMHEAGSLVGDELTGMVNRNRDLLVKRYSDRGAIVVDNLSKVPDSCFVDRNWPTEHYNLSGKTIVAQSVYESLRQYKLAK